MRDSTNLCQAIPAVPYCPNRASAASSFCPEHAAELRALEEREKTATREAGRLKAIMDRMLAEGTNAYTTAREVMEDEQVVQLYSKSLGRQIDAAVALKTRFLSEAEDRHSEGVAALEERKGVVEAFLAALRARADELDQMATAESPSISDADDPPAYPILEDPPPPYACTANSSDNRPNRCGPPRRCTADGERCRWKCRSGQRFCRLHSIKHILSVEFLENKAVTLEKARMRVTSEERDNARRIKDVKDYVEKLEDMIEAIEDHQRSFSCRAPDSQTALLKDLKQRRTTAVLLLAKLSGRKDGETAAKQGQAETWATAFLVEVKAKDARELRTSVEDILVSAVVSGVLTWLGLPWARSAIVGVVSSLVARKAHDSIGN